MRIVMIPCTYTWLNLGDVAMLQAAVRRLRALWPQARVEIPTKNPDALLTHCPDARPLPHGEWFSERYLLGRLHRRLPPALSRRLIGLKHDLRRWPALEASAIGLKLRLTRAERASFETYWRAINRADLIVISGAGGITDVFPGFTRSVLETLAFAIRRGVPTAMFGHGFGRLRSPELMARAAAVLPRVDLIALRESRLGLPLLKQLKVAEQRVMVTGDDAVEMAYRTRPAKLGAKIGINMRTMAPADLDDNLIADIRSVVQEFAGTLGASFIPLPIALQQATDARAIAQVIEGCEQPSNDEPRLGNPCLDSPREVIARAGECRIVITGAYHAAVFALAQGVPAICVAKSEYFLDKFSGLAELFPAGCRVVRLDSRDLRGRLATAIKTAWDTAEQVRPLLLENARSQVRMNRQAEAALQALIARRAIQGDDRASALAPFADPRARATSAD